jgi:RND family efflux transporter MFP subunit
MVALLSQLAGWKRLLLVVLVVVAGLVAWRWSQPRAVQTSPVVSVFPSQTLSVLNASGYVVAQRKAAVSTKASGRLEWLGVTEGSRVEAGALIARLESNELQAQLGQARAQVGLAEAELADAQRAYERAQSLLAKSYISQSASDAALARFDKARAQLRAAQAGQQVAVAALGQTEIRAPFTGVVLTKNANVGDNITPFSSAADTKGAVVMMADMSTLEVEADVSESSMAKIRVGQPVEIGLDGLPNERFEGRVARMVPTIDRAKATRLIKIEFLEIDDRVLPDMSAKVAFLERRLSPAERFPMVAVNRAAVSQRQGRWVVFVVEDGKAKAIDLALSAAPTTDLVPAPMLAVGQRVVLRPPEGLAAGDRLASDTVAVDARESASGR